MQRVDPTFNSNLYVVCHAVRYYAEQMANETQRRLPVKTLANLVCMVSAADSFIRFAQYSTYAQSSAPCACLLHVCAPVRHCSAWSMEGVSMAWTK